MLERSLLLLLLLLLLLRMAHQRPLFCFRQPACTSFLARISSPAAMPSAFAAAK